MTDEKIIALLGEKLRSDGGEPTEATVLSFVTWEEIYTAVVNELRMLGVLPPDITIRSCDDWIAVYKDGVKVESGHSCSLSRGLEALGIAFEEADYDEEMDYDTGVLKDGTDPFPERLP